MSFVKNPEALPESNSDYFKFPVGSTYIRIISQPVAVPKTFKDGTSAIQVKCYALIKQTTDSNGNTTKISELKVVNLPMKVVNTVEAAIEDGFYPESYPMRFDLKICRTGTTQTDTKYECIISPNVEPNNEAYLMWVDQTADLPAIEPVKPLVDVDNPSMPQDSDFPQ